MLEQIKNLNLNYNALVTIQEGEIIDLIHKTLVIMSCNGTDCIRSVLVIDLFNKINMRIYKFFKTGAYSQD